MNGTQKKTRLEQKQIQYFKASIECKKQKTKKHDKQKKNIFLYTYPDNLGSQVMKSFVIPVQ